MGAGVLNIGGRGSGGGHTHFCHKSRGLRFFSSGCSGGGGGGVLNFCTSHENITAPSPSW